jgi:hypothetical protein
VKETAWQGEMALLFEGFIGGGLQSGDGVILIATTSQSPCEPRNAKRFDLEAAGANKSSSSLW